jgi:2-hydroxy-6-oxonona-2,4-dienedioate hydrolase
MHAHSGLCSRYDPCAGDQPMKARDITTQPESRWAPVVGLRVHARVWDPAAPADAPRVVLVHGIGVASRDFAGLGARLAPDARVYAVDLPGFGESDKPARLLTIPDQAEILANWMDALDLAPAMLLANSVGCQIAAHEDVSPLVADLYR